MNHFIHGVTRAIVETFELPQPIVEIGSYQVAGQEAIANLRSLFPGKEYVGIDMRPGPGVDRVANVEALPFVSGSVGTILALNTFEHVRCFWRGLDEVHRVLRPDGALVMSTPFHFRIHQFPHDYWRFTPAAYETLLRVIRARSFYGSTKNRPAMCGQSLFARAGRDRRNMNYRQLMSHMRTSRRRRGRAAALSARGFAVRPRAIRGASGSQFAGCACRPGRHQQKA